MPMFKSIVNSLPLASRKMPDDLTIPYIGSHPTDFPLRLKNADISLFVYIQ